MSEHACICRAYKRSGKPRLSACSTIYTGTQQYSASSSLKNGTCITIVYRTTITTTIFIVHHHSHHHHSHDRQPFAPSPFACCLMLRSLQQCRKIPSCLPPRCPAATPGQVTTYSIATTTHHCHYCLSLPSRPNHPPPVVSAHLPGCG